ncbi:7-carboxy-7-deazaguanine synthase QueE [Jiulongibacter sediminis]|uniref:7-carboxy-7-deazaguanine synthase QueE n=1 Tax=Jiulongibacter sediminis TaxID=1605367 RepID=UPI0026F1E923|nr:7-carboxy-7-deazaguanine synthase QueE [Jiulongibacter sediminis]
MTVKTAKNTDLPIMESFYTIQGEGFHTGKAAYFIRLGGCDVGCVWCDVKESWNAEDHPFQTLEEIVAGAEEHMGKMVVITGGEPLMYDMGPLTSALKSRGFQTNIETSGAYPMTGEWDWVCFSPKKFKEAHKSIFPLADELKVIIFNKSDFKFAEKYAALVSKNCQLMLQPEWDKQEQMLPLIIDYVKENPQWKISLQTHKWMGVP